MLLLTGRQTSGTSDLRSTSVWIPYNDHYTIEHDIVPTTTSQIHAKVSPVSIYLKPVFEEVDFLFRQW